MKEDKDNYWDDDIVGAVNRFKNSLISGRTTYFDVSEFEGIVEQLLEEGDLQASEIAAKQGIQIHPNAVPLQLKYAQVLLNKGHYKKSLKYLQLAEKMDESNPDVHLLKGSARMVMGNESEALMSFRKAIKFAGSDIDEILYHIGSTYAQIGEIKKAIYYFEKAVRTNPTNDLALYDLGFFHDQEGNYHKSIKYYNLYLDNDPFNHYVWFNLGTVYNKTENHKKAIEAYEFAYAINDKFHMSLFNIGNALANDERFEEAIEKYNEFLEKEPDNDDAYCYIGECYLNLEDNIKSEYYYQKALQINKKNDTGWFGIGLIRWVEQQYQESIEYIRKAVTLDDFNSEYWLTLGKVYKDYNHLEEAGKALKKAARIEPENAEIWLTWAELYLKFGEDDNAIRILKKGVETNDDSILKYRLVGVLLQKKKQKEALSMLEIALEQNFDNLSYLYSVCPKSLKNKKIKRLVQKFQEENYGKR